MASLSSPPMSSCHNHRPLPTTLKTKQRSLSLSKPVQNSLTLVREITRLCERGSLSDALSLLRNDALDHVVSAQTTRDAIGALIQACGEEREIEIGRRVHELVWSLKASGLCNDVVLNTRLVTMYSVCGSPLESRSVFDGLERRDLFLWNALVSAYSRNGLYLDAIGAFVGLLSGSEFRPDSFTLASVLKACSGSLDAGLGRSVHGVAAKSGLTRDVFVGNALVGMYGKCGLLGDASQVFDEMPQRNPVSWNSMLRGLSESRSARESYELFGEALREGLSPDDATLATLLPVCAAEGNAEMGIAVHGLAVKSGLDGDLLVNNSLMDVYLKCGRFSEADVLFARNGDKNVVSWNTMIGGLAREGDIHKAFDVLRRMQREQREEDGNARVDRVTVLNLLPACSDGENGLSGLREIHGFALRRGFHGDELVANALVSAYAKCGSPGCARRVFRGIKSKTVGSWNALIGGLAQNGDPGSALDFYFRMKDRGFGPDWFSIGSLILACARLRFLPYGKQIHGFALRNGFDADAFIVTSLMSLYIHCNEISAARDLFYRTEDKTLACWNTMLGGYSQLRSPDEAFSLFREMISVGVRPCKITITSVFEACSQLSALRLGKELHCFALKADFAGDAFVSCSMLDMYAKTGCMEQARTVFDNLKEKDLASWNVVITGYGINGHGNKALEIFREMRRSGLNPDRFTFIGILMACSHAGMVAEGLKHLNDMRDSYGIAPKLEHYACVVDMLGRAGKLDEALRLAEEMPEEPDPRIWSSLLSCCRSHGDWETGEKIARKLLESEPEKAENYVLVSNLHAASGKWDEAKRVRRKMKEAGLQKEAGCSWIEIGGKVYSFVAGDDNNLEDK